ncbi:unnamed protein product, partial [Hapterophycus canaliculatus]
MTTATGSGTTTLTSILPTRWKWVHKLQKRCDEDLAVNTAIKNSHRPNMARRPTGTRRSFCDQSQGVRQATESILDTLSSSAAPHGRISKASFNGGFGREKKCHTFVPGTSSTAPKKMNS